MKRTQTTHTKRDEAGMKSDAKVFCIGLGKTGTTSMSVILDRLGYQHKTGPIEDGLIWQELGQLDKLWSVVEKFDSFDDFPYPYLYKELYHKYPHAKFILTIRKTPEEWLNSLKKHSLRNGPTTAHLLAYGCYSPIGHEEHLLELYKNHISEVTKFFSGCENFIKVDLANENTSKTLSNFLAIEPEEITIPIANSAVGKNPIEVIDNLLRKNQVGAAIHFAKTQEERDKLLEHIAFKIKNRRTFFARQMLRSFSRQFAKKLSIQGRRATMNLQ